MEKTFFIAIMVCFISVNMFAQNDTTSPQEKYVAPILLTEPILLTAGPKKFPQYHPPEKDNDSLQVNLSWKIKNPESFYFDNNDHHGKFQEAPLNNNLYNMATPETLIFLGSAALLQFILTPKNDTEP